MSQPLSGHCPSCSTVLYVENGLTDLICRNPSCKRRTAAAEILSETERGHIVIIGERDFSMKHPLVERISDELFECKFMSYMSSLLRTPVAPGKYRVVPENDPNFRTGVDIFLVVDNWRWELIE